MRTLACFALLLVAVPTSAQPIALPQVNDERLKIELVAQHPDISTPIAIDMDDAGKLYVIESHTHFPPGNYTGPSGDRVRVYEDLNGDHKADRITNFHVGERHLMSIRLSRHDAPGDAGKTAPLYAATRREIFRLRDTNNDGVADERTTIVKLDTKGDYPHNGLAGITFDFKGDMYFGFGENLGEPYKLIGADGVTLEGGGEGGNIYSCDKDGNKLRRVATGFWNPFDITFDAFGRCFAVDNDPDSRPPCRLLHIVEGGDYGYRFKYGRKGLHPFTSWNGEIPGTLPMVAGTGEAPSGMLAYESDNLPDDYLGTLLVTSWGDHRIERYRLKPHGASFTSKMEPIVTGGDNFRPVGITLAPDGSIYFSDWVDKSYNVHGKGRIWRLSAKEEKKTDRPDPVKEPEKAILSRHRATREKAARELVKSPMGQASLQAVLSAAAESARTLAVAAVSLATAGKMNDALVGRLFTKDSADLRVLVAGMVADQAPPEMTEMLARSDLAILGATLQHGKQEASKQEWFINLSDPFAQHAAIQRLFRASWINDLLVRTPNLESTLLDVHTNPLINKWGGVVAFIRMQQASGQEASQASIPDYLKARHADIRFAAIQWIAEARLEKYRQALLDSLSRPDTTPRLFAATLAALDMLDGGKPQSADHVGGRWYLERLVFGDKTPAATRAAALRMLPANNPALKFDALQKLVEQEDARLRLEAVRTLRDAGWTGGEKELKGEDSKKRAAALSALAKDDKQPIDVRTEAIAGLNGESAEDAALLVQLAATPALRGDALRNLRGIAIKEAHKAALTAIGKDAAWTEAVDKALDPAKVAARPPATDVAAWLKLLDALPKEKEDAPATDVKEQRKEGDDAKAQEKTQENEAKAQAFASSPGERVFFSLKAGGCFRCHTVAGRGGEAGPDLSTIGKTLTRERLLESILQPSKEIAPRFTASRVKKTDGEELVLMYVGPSPDGTQIWSDTNGKAVSFQPAEVESREALKTSIMPEGLHAAMTLREMRDLLVYLASLK